MAGGVMGTLRKAGRPTLWPTPHDIIWAAGIYEGEGTCGRSGASRTGMRCEQVSIVQKDRWLVDRLYALFGGGVSRNRESWLWNLSGARARGFLMSIYQFQSPRRQAQIQRAFHWLDEHEEEDE